jgi:endonuclease III
MSKLTDELLALAKKQFAEKETIRFTADEAANKQANDLTACPQAFVLGCLMDRQDKTERAWTIPSRVFEHFKTADIEKLASISAGKYLDLFLEEKLHRFPETMAQIFRLGVIRLNKNYNGNAANIWKGKPASALVVYRFLEFDGCGPKIATMAANILARQFKIPFADYYSIDLSLDVHVKRVMTRMGIVPANASAEQFIYKARELNPEFPGIIDSSLWKIGNQWCKKTKPECAQCIVNGT